MLRVPLKTLLIRSADWRSLCLIAFALFIGVVFWSISVYRQIERGDFLPQDIKETLLPSGFDRARMEKATAFFDAKEVRFTELLGRPLQLAGPGVPVSGKTP